MELSFLLNVCNLLWDCGLLERASVDAQLIQTPYMYKYPVYYLTFTVHQTGTWGDLLKKCEEVSDSNPVALF